MVGFSGRKSPNWPVIKSSYPQFEKDLSNYISIDDHILHESQHAVVNFLFERLTVKPKKERPLLSFEAFGTIGKF